MTRTRTATRILMLSMVLVTVMPMAQLVLRGAQDSTLSVTGCLLLSRQEGVFALHMDYNRIAVMGHPELASHVRHRVTLRGTFETRVDGLRFLVDDVREVAPTCEVQV